jgi:hypothetical protein
MHIESLENWMDGMKPVIEEESHFLDTKSDLIKLSLPPGHVRGDEVLENFLERNWGHFFSTQVR